MNDKKILLADDSRFFLELERKFLEKTQARILLATSAREVFALCSRELPDLVCMDVNLPGEGGVACCRRIKAASHLERIPVILIHGVGKGEEAAACQASCCDAVLTKPLNRQAFLDTGRRLLPVVERRDRRVPCRTTVFFSTREGTFYGITNDVSANGIYLVETSHTLQKGDSIKVHFMLPGESTGLIEAEGRIAWTNQGQGRIKPVLPEGFGIEFHSLPEDSANRLQRFISRT